MEDISQHVLTVVEKPWGRTVEIARGFSWCLKILELEPNQRFSLQQHEHRTEYWLVAAGEGTVQTGWKIRRALPGKFFYIPRLRRHRLTAGPHGLYVVELQRGICKEEDIERLEDDYGRT